ncbi:MAG: hypothetical protein ACFE95_02605 [Candidatus Hodarchaeota archaeon]
MAFSDEFKNRFLNNPSIVYELLVYIKDTNSKWTDFSNRVLDKNTLLANLSTIKFSNESNVLTPIMITQMASIEMDNSGGFWDEPFPTIYTEDGSEASFTVSKGNQLSIVEDHDIQFRIKLITGKSEEIYNLITLRIESIVTTEYKATLSLRSYSQILKEKSAEKVRNRDGWYQYKTVPFLVRELLKLEFGDSNGKIPNTFIIPQTIQLSDPNNERVFSILGRPPTNIDTDSDGLAEKSYESTLTPRWLLGLSGDPTTLDTTTLNTVHDNVTYLLFGCDHKLFSYCIATDVYEHIGSLSDSDYHIERLWLNDRDNVIYGMALTTLSSPSTASGGRSHAIHSQDLMLFKYDGSSVASLTTIIWDDVSANRTSEFVYPCYYFKRESGTTVVVGGGQDFIVIGDYDGDISGYNIPIPFSQYVKWDTRNHIAAQQKVRHGDYEDESLSGTEHDEGWTPRGFAALKSQISETASSFSYGTANFTINQQGFLLFEDSTGANGRFIFAKMVAAYQNKVGAAYTGDNQIVKIVKIENESPYTITEVNSDLTNAYTTIGTLPVHPNCGVLLDDSLWICGTSFSILDTDVGIGYAIMHIDLSTDTTTTLAEYDTHDIDMHMFLEAIYYLGTATNGNLILTSHSPYRNVSDTSTMPLYHICRFNLDTNTLTTIADFTSQPYGLTVGDDISGLDQYIYFIDSSSGALKKINTTTWTVDTENDGKSITETEFAIYSNLVFDSHTNSNGVIWGVSHPNGFREESFEGRVPGEGKYQLFKYDNRYFPLIELADFNGLNIWEAISLLAQKCYYIVGFNENGDFFMVPRDISGNDVDYTLDENYQPLIIKNDRGFKEIANLIRVIPYYSKLGELECELLIKDRSKEEDVSTVGEDEIVLRQSGTRSQILRLYCVRSGDGNIGADTYLGYPMFKFLLYENVLEVKLTSGALSTDTTLYLSSVYGGDDATGGIHTGDYVGFESANGGEIIRRIEGDLSSGNIDYDDLGITIDTSLGEAFSSGTLIKIYRKYRPSSADADYGKLWSDEGITYVSGAHAAQTTITVQSVENLCKNTVIQISGTTSGIVYEVRISSINDSNNQITVSSAVTCADGATVKAYWAPYESGTCFYIGGTGIGIVLDSGTAKCEFKVGDIFTITAPGLILEEDIRSPQIAYDTTSISRYGERELEIKNRFFNRRDAEFLSTYLLNEYKNPRMLSMVTTSYMPFITMTNDDDQLTKLSIISSKRFPKMPRNRIAGYARTIQHQPMSNRTLLLIRSAEDY